MMNDIIDARIVELRRLRKPNNRHQYTTKQISKAIFDEFGITRTQGQVKHLLAKWRKTLSPEERAEQCVEGRVKGITPMPPPGTKLQCQSCGQLYFAPDVPNRCIRYGCPTTLRSGERLAEGCEEWREPEL